MMAKWKKQTRLLKNANSVEERIQRLMYWASDLDFYKAKDCLQSAFRTLNNPNRYKYCWQDDTRTHQQFLTFFILMRELCKREGSLGDWYNQIVEVLQPDTDKSWVTLYLITSIYRKKERDLSSIGFHFTKNDAHGLLQNASTSNKAFRGVSYYEYVDKANEVIDCMKRHKPVDLENINVGSLTAEIEARRNKSDKSKKPKHKMHVLLSGGEW